MTNENDGEKLVRTPGGPRRKSLVHHIGADETVDFKHGDVRRVRPDGTSELLDHVKRERGIGGLDRGGVPPGSEVGPGWVADAYWINNSGESIAMFYTRWVVPPPPATQHEQTIFVFSGIQSAMMILQPVLQWGTSHAGGGNYWGVASWCVGDQNSFALHSPLTPVNPGDELVGVITQTAHDDKKLGFRCSVRFEGIESSLCTLTCVPDELNWSVLTLEAYGTDRCSDYPNTPGISFRDVAVTTASGVPEVIWTPYSFVKDCGAKARVTKGDNPGGAVTLECVG